MGKIFQATCNTRGILEESVRFIRSDVPTVVAKEEAQWLVENRIVTVIDLREEEERKGKPCPLERDERFRYLCMPVTGGNGVPESVDQVADSYFNMVDGQMQRIVETALNAKSNVLYFCNAGKDRTGVVSALLLRRLGMSKEYIIKDYMKSKDNLQTMLNEFAKSHPEIDVNIITPNKIYMEQFLAKIEKATNTL